MYHGQPPFCFSCVANTSSGDRPGRNGHIGSCSRGPGGVGTGDDFLCFLVLVALAGTWITWPSPPASWMSCEAGICRCRRWRIGLSSPLAMRRRVVVGEWPSSLAASSTLRLNLASKDAPLTPVRSLIVQASPCGLVVVFILSIVAHLHGQEDSPRHCEHGARMPLLISSCPVGLAPVSGASLSRLFASLELANFGVGVIS